MLCNQLGALASDTPSQGLLGTTGQASRNTVFEGGVPASSVPTTRGDPDVALPLAAARAHAHTHGLALPGEETEEDVSLVGQNVKSASSVRGPRPGSLNVALEPVSVPRPLVAPPRESLVLQAPPRTRGRTRTREGGGPTPAALRVTGACLTASVNFLPTCLQRGSLGRDGPEP